MTEHLQKLATGRPALSLRHLMLLLVTAGVLYVAAIALYITVRIGPTARALQGHSAQVLQAHDKIRASLARMDANATKVRVLAAHPSRVDPDSSRALTLAIRASLDSITALQASQQLDGAPTPVRVALATAASHESATGILLLNVLADLELDHTTDVTPILHDAEASRDRAEAMLRLAERSALSDLVTREERLGEAATAAARAVIWWLLLGLVLVPLLVMFLRRRVYRPLERIESALTSVARGDLHTTIENQRDDELGRLANLFNTMTSVIRQRRDEERQQGRDALRESEDRFRAAFENAALGMMEMAPDGRYISANPAFCRLLEYTAEELADKLAADITHPDDRAKDDELRRLVASGAQPMYRHEQRLIKKGGMVVWVVVTVAPVRRRDGSIAYWVGICEDMTERRSLQKQLVESQRLESVGRLAGGVAHDFNNLLTAILGNKELALTYISEDHPSAQFLDEIERAGSRAADLTRQLLAFARRQVVEPKVVDLNKLTHDMDKLLRRVIGAQVDLATSLAPDLGATKVDPTQFEQVIMNLAVNARDAMPNGGRLTIETANVELDEEYAGIHPQARAGRYVMMAVSDNGIGMDELTRASIFEPFFTTKDRAKGTGLGLSTVHGIIHQAGGHIWVYSEPNRGATFKVYLPRTDEPVQVVQPMTRNTPVPRGIETILLVEDERQVRELLATGLRNQGYRVLTAGDGQEALAMAGVEDGAVDLLVTDVVLPLMNGRELALKLTERRPELPVLYISGYAEEAVVHQGVVDAGVAFMSKPFTVADLGRRAREILDGRRPNIPS